MHVASDILLLAGSCDVVGIDEAQFFDDAIVDVCNALANSGKRVIVAGLDMDYEGRPFGPMPYLLAVAEFVTKVHAICAQTGELASFSFRLADNDEKVLLGERDKYEARSRTSFLEGMRARRQKIRQCVTVSFFFLDGMVHGKLRTVRSVGQLAPAPFI